MERLNFSHGSTGDLACAVGSCTLGVGAVTGFGLSAAHTEFTMSKADASEMLSKEVFIALIDTPNAGLFIRRG
jgi:hypothetical protein